MINFISLYLYFIKIWWKVYVFPNNSSITVQKFRLLDHVILLDAATLDMTLKRLVSILNSVFFWLVRLIWKSQMLVIITKNDKYLNSMILLTFWNQTLFKRYLEVLSGTIFQEKVSEVFRSNFLKMSVSSDKNI